MMCKDLAMATDASAQYNEASKQTRRIALLCPTTHKKLGVVSDTGEWPADLQQWLWCRGCHKEHLIEKKQVEEARAQDARTRTTI